MKLGYILLSILCLFSLSAKAQSVGSDDYMADKELQIIKCLQRMDVDYSADYDAGQFGLPAPDSISLRNQYGNEVLAYEICPAIPVGIIICISGIDAPSASAYFGHAMEFYKLGYATISMDVSNHTTINNRPYEEIKDVQAVIDHIKSKIEYTSHGSLSSGRDSLSLALCLAIVQWIILVLLINMHFLILIFHTQSPLILC